MHCWHTRWIAPLLAHKVACILKCAAVQCGQLGLLPWCRLSCLSAISASYSIRLQKLPCKARTSLPFRISTCMLQAAHTLLALSPPWTWYAHRPQLLRACTGLMLQECVRHAFSHCQDCCAEPCYPQLCYAARCNAVLHVSGVCCGVPAVLCCPLLN